MDCIFQIVGRKDSGKTLVIERAVSALKRRGLTVATVKHTHHEINPSRKDTARFMNAGSDVTILHSNDCALLWRCSTPDYLDLIPADVVLVEGFADRDLGKKIVVNDPSDADRVVKEIVEEASQCKLEASVEVFPKQKDKMVYMTLYKLMKKWGIKEVKLLD
ncbi:MULTISPECIES: molybdopterin-guanine dinucleotide biosynthesis protein B [Metallosphaera]|uniref:molybdopterin-guanine dinucleotide biosynthesis protein B n=1 Tax=Metallosphaera TaxID=41980 RepID=UPI001F06A945|nr:molybdopterin-guanine dinucleotide biosynthesis protein B [Metallosphaera sedula]MCH1770704.1 molybdopterin-guanine dinucleotide biosynthesis protein B [Metallosphaera sedula]MCP6728902.1 molybdopterin-guanine dinucleotide biosynthesis protein B [Metallosphaera sedula]BBL48172.1 molybdopterin-guanine dinucleotide biosynthesis protein MobB [Metallosphaera sedula]